MAISKSVNGSNTTVSFSYTAPTVKVEDTLRDAAKYLYDKTSGHGVMLDEGETIDNLTNAEVGAIVDHYVKTILRDAAATYHVLAAGVAARTAAEAENSTKYL